jgi:hypothetical protein
MSYKRFEHTQGFYPWRRNWFYTFSLLLYTKCSGQQEFLDSHMWAYFLPCLWMCVSIVALTSSSSTRLEYWIHMVLMNLQDIDQMSIKVAQREHGATAVQVCGLNPAE